MSPPLVQRKPAPAPQPPPPQPQPQPQPPPPQAPGSDKNNHRKNDINGKLSTERAPTPTPSEAGTLQRTKRKGVDSGAITLDEVKIEKCDKDDRVKQMLRHAIKANDFMNNVVYDTRWVSVPSSGLVGWLPPLSELEWPEPLPICLTHFVDDVHLLLSADRLMNEIIIPAPVSRSSWTAWSPRRFQRTPS